MLKLENISKKMGNFSLSGVSLDIHDSEYYVLLGRSGAGKTQLLELIAGLSEPDSGTLWLDNENITNKKIQDRKIGLLFQDYAIFPNMTVFGNIAYSLHSRHLDKDTIRKEVTRIAEEMNICDHLNRFTHDLSGGELQRVALARTLVTSPRLLLLDEPLASIDANLKDDIKRFLRKLNNEGQTIIHVTHDYSEAVSLATRVGVIHNGTIIQEGTPDEVFGKPVNRFVARYAGIRNFFNVRFTPGPGSGKAISDGKMEFNIIPGNHQGEGLIIIRGSEISLSDSDPQSGINCFGGKVIEIIPSEHGMEVTINAGEIFYVDVPIREFRMMKIAKGSEAWISIPPEACVVLKQGG